MSSNTYGDLRIAEQHLIQGKLNEAIEVYEKVAQSDPNNLNIKNRLGELYVRADRTKAATDIFLSLARGYTQSGHTLKAIAFFKKTLKLDPENAHAYFELGSLYAGTGLVAEAEKHYLQAADLFGPADPDNSIAGYEAAVGIAGGSPELRMRLASFCEKNEFVDRAHEEYIKAGDAFAEKGDDVRALDSYDRALSVHPDSKTARELIARIVKKLGIEGAERLDGTDRLDRRIPPRRSPARGEEFTKAETVNLKEVLASKDVQPQGNEDDSFVVRQISKAEIMLGFGQVDEALAMMQELVLSSPDEPKVRKKLKDIYLRSGMADKAAQEYVELARIYNLLGDKQAAAESLASARSLAPAAVDGGSNGQQSFQTTKLNTPAGGLRAVDSGEMRRLASEPPRVEPKPSPAQTVPSGGYMPRVEAGPGGEARISVDMRQGVETGTRVEPPRPVEVKPRVEAPRVEAAPPVESKPRVDNTPTELKRPEPVQPARRSDELIAKEAVPAPAVVTENSDDLLERLAELEHPAQTKPVKQNSGAKVMAAGAQTVAVAAPAETTAAPAGGTFLGVSLDEEQKAAKSGGGRRVALVAMIVVLLGGGAAAYMKFGLKKGSSNTQLAQNRPPENLAPAPVPSASPDQLTVDVSSTGATTQPTEDPAANSRDQSQEDARQQRLRDEQERQRQLQLQQQQAQQNRGAQPSPTGSAPPPTPQPTRQNAAAPPQMQNIGANPVAPAMGAPGSGGLSSSTPAAPAPLPQTAQPRRSSGPVQGSVLRRVEPVYPQAARTANVSGSVSVEVSIDERGNVVGARAISGSAMLAASAVSAARGFKFSPTTLDGVPVRSSRVIVFNFRL